MINRSTPLGLHHRLPDGRLATASGTRRHPNGTDAPPVSLIVAFTIRSDRSEPLQTAPELAELQQDVFKELRPSRSLANGLRGLASPDGTRCRVPPTELEAAFASWVRGQFKAGLGTLHHGAARGANGGKIPGAASGTERAEHRPWSARGGNPIRSNARAGPRSR